MAVALDDIESKVDTEVLNRVVDSGTMRSWDYGPASVMPPFYRLQNILLTVSRPVADESRRLTGSTQEPRETIWL
jgi:hypothetical protein